MAPPSRSDTHPRESRAVECVVTFRIVGTCLDVSTSAMWKRGAGPLSVKIKSGLLPKFRVQVSRGPRRCGETHYPEGEHGLAPAMGRASQGGCGRGNSYLHRLKLSPPHVHTRQSYLRRIISSTHAHTRYRVIFGGRHPVGPQRWAPTRIALRLSSQQSGLSCRSLCTVLPASAPPIAFHAHSSLNERTWAGASCQRAALEAASQTR